MKSFIFEIIGLLDVDVYGPSLPILIHPTDPTVRRSSLGSGMVLPISHEGVKLLSLGFVSPKVILQFTLSIGMFLNLRLFI